MTPEKCYIITESQKAKVYATLADESDSDELRFAAFDALKGVENQPAPDIAGVIAAVKQLHFDIFDCKLDSEEIAGSLEDILELLRPLLKEVTP